MNALNRSKALKTVDKYFREYWKHITYLSISLFPKLRSAYPPPPPLKNSQTIFRIFIDTVDTRVITSSFVSFFLYPDFLYGILFPKMKFRSKKWVRMAAQFGKR